MKILVTRSFSLLFHTKEPLGPNVIELVMANWIL